MDKTLLLILVSNLPTLASVCGAIYLASLGKDGWGWLLFVAIVLSTTVNVTRSTT